MTLVVNMKVTADTRSAVTELDRVTAAELAVGRAARAAGQNMSSGFQLARTSSDNLLHSVNNVKDGLFRLTAAFGVTAVITQFTRGIVDSSNKMIGWRQSFNAAAGSATEGAISLEYARSEADRLGISLDTSTFSFAKLTAATRGTSLAGQQVRDIFTSISEASRVLNLSAEQTTGALRAIEQMISKGNVQAEELRGQLAERIPGAFALAADAMNVTTAELSKMLERGEVLASDMLPKLAVKLREFYGAAAVDAAKTPAAEFARLQNAILELQVAIGNAGFMQVLSTGAKDLTIALTNLAKGGSLDTIASLLANLAIVAVGVFSAKLLNGVGAYTRGIYEASLATSVLVDTEVAASRATLAQTEATVHHNVVSLERIAIARGQLASELALNQSMILGSKEMIALTGQSTKDMAKLSSMLAVRTAAVQELALAEANLIRLNAQANSLAKARAITEAQLAIAVAAHGVAQLGLVGALTTSQILMQKATLAAKGLFNALGGWTTVALAGVYVLYQLINAHLEYEESLRAPFPALNELNAKMREQIRLQNIINSGRANAGNVEAVSQYEKYTAQIAKFNVELVNAEMQLANLVSGGDRVSSSLRNSLLSTIEDIKLKISSGNATLSEFISLSIQSGQNIPPEFQRVVDKVNEVKDSLMSMFGVMNQVPTITLAVTKAEQDFNETLKSKIEKLNLSRIEQENGLRSALIYEAASKRATELNISQTEAMVTMSAETIHLIDNIVSLTNASKAHATAEQSAESALRNKDAILRKSNEAIEQQRTAYDKLKSISEEISSSLDGDFAQAENDHAGRLREISSLVQTMIEKKTQLNDLGISAADIFKAEADAIAASNRQFEIANRVAKVTETNRKSLGTVIDRALKGLKEENKTLKSSNTQLAIQEAILVATAEAQSDYANEKRETMELTILENAAIVSGAQALVELNEKQQDVNDSQQELKDILADITQGDGFDQLIRKIELVGAALKEALDQNKPVAELEAALGSLRQQMAIHMVEAAGQVLNSIQSLAKEGSKSYKAMEVASHALNVVMAISAILNQGKGDPYSAFARMAAMAIAVAGLIGSIGGSFGGSNGFSDTAAERQESQGSGTVLGDAEAKSESILNSLEITADATSTLVGINRSMLNALIQLQNNISSASGMLARGAGQAGFDALPIARAFRDVFLGGALSFLRLDPLNLLGGSSRVTDQGIQLGGGGLNNINASAYQETQSRSWRFGSLRRREQTVGLPDEVASQFQLIMDSIVDTVREGALALGVLPAEIEAALAAFSLEEIRISLKDLSAEEQQTELNAVFSSIFDGLVGSVVPFIEQFQRVGEGLGETLVRVATGVQVTQEALLRLGFALDETGPEAFAQISESLITMVGGIEEFISGMANFVDNFAPETHKFELLQNDITRALEQVGLAVPTTREAMWILMQTLDATTESGREQIATLLRLSGVADQYYTQLENNINSVTDVARELAEFTQGIADAIIGQEGSDFENSMLRITRSTASYIKDANAIARAQGAEGASTRDLALIHRWAANEIKKALRQLEDAARSVIDELGYGPLSILEQQIAALEASYQVGIDGAQGVADAAEDLFGQWEDGIRSLGEYIDSLLVGDLSPLSPEDQFLEAQRQLNEALAAAQGGDVNALNSLPQLAEQFLQMLRAREASGVDYSDPANALIAQLQALGINPYSPVQGTTPVELVPSEALIELYAQRDEMIANEEAIRRLALAEELAGYLRELAQTSGETIFEVAERLGVNFAAFITDLGGIITAETASQVLTLVEVANILGVELPALADQLGLSLGELTDAQSLLNDAFELQLSFMPQEIRDQLEPLLRAVELAVGPEETNNALNALAGATNELPEELRLQLAPFLEGVDIEFPDILNELDFLSSVDANTFAANELLFLILEEIRNLDLLIPPPNVPPPDPGGPNSIDGSSSIAIGEGSYAKMQSFENNQSAIIYELQETRSILAKLALEQKLRDEQRDREIKSQNEAAAVKVANAVNDLKMSGTDKYRN